MEEPDMVSQIGATLLQRAAVNNELVATESEIEAYASRNAACEEQLAERREAQARVFSFVNTRLLENHEVITSLEQTIQAAEASGEAAHAAFDAAEAKTAYETAAELLEYRREIEECEAEARALREFARGRDALEADLVALEAMRAALETETDSARDAFEKRCEQDRSCLEREAEKAASTAKTAAMAEATAKLDPATRRRVAEHRKMTSELELHARETNKLEISTIAKVAEIASLRRRLVKLRRAGYAIAKRTTVRRRVEAGLADGDRANSSIVNQAILDATVERADNDASMVSRRVPDDDDDDDDDMDEGDEEDSQSKRAVVVVVKQPALSQHDVERLNARIQYERQLREARDADTTLDRMLHLQSPEIAAMLQAANDLFPQIAVNHWTDLDGPNADGARVEKNYLSRVFANLHAAGFGYRLIPHRRPPVRAEDLTLLKTTRTDATSETTSACDSWEDDDRDGDVTETSALSPMPYSYGGILSPYGGAGDSLHSGGTAGDGSTVQLPRLASKPSVASSVGGAADDPPSLADATVASTKGIPPPAKSK